MSKREIIGAGFPGLPISEGIVTDHLIFLCGQIGCIPGTDCPVSDKIGPQTEQAIENIRGLLEKAGSDLSKITMAQIFISNPEDFDEMNAAYSKYFSESPPCRTTVAAKIIDSRYKVEITVTAIP